MVHIHSDCSDLPSNRNICLQMLPTLQLLPQSAIRIVNNMKYYLEMDTVNGLGPEFVKSRSASMRLVSLHNLKETLP